MPHSPFYQSAPWRKARAKYLQSHPYCWDCALIHMRVRANEVDHIVPIEKGGAPLDPANFRARCKTHHSQKTLVLDVKKPRRTKLVTTGIDGYPIEDK